MIDFLKNNYGWFLLAFILLQVFARSSRKSGAGMKSESAKPPADTAKPPADTAKPPASTRGKRKGEAKILSRSGDIQNSFQDINIRFEKAVNMATDSTNQVRRDVGFVALGQMLFSNRENFDALTEENKAISEYLALNNFKMAGDIRNSFQKLYEGYRVRYSEENHNLSELLYDKTHRPDIDNATLNLWREIVNWNRRKFDLHPVAGIFATARWQPRTHFFIFSGINLSGVNFLVAFGGGKIDFPTEDMYVNFNQCCFLQVEMQEADVSYVDFSGSHLSRVNHINYGTHHNMKCIGTIFDFANLINCNLRGTDFKDASFIGTNITGTDFHGTKNLTQKQFKEGAYWIRPGRPLFPSNFPRDFADTLPDRDPE